MARKKMKNETRELIPADTTPVWSAITDEDGVHRLYYGKKPQERGTTPADLNRFRSMAELGNKRGFAPRPRTECIADLSSHPVKPLKRSERSTAETPAEQ